MNEQYLLKGLSCPVCAAKIEDSLKARPEISDASISLMNETLNLTIAPSAPKPTVAELQSLINTIEPGVTVSEKAPKTPRTEQYLLKGLGCPVCAAKIEDSLKAHPDISDASINLMNETLNLTLVPSVPPPTVAELQSLIDTIESGVIVSEKVPEQIAKPSSANRSLPVSGQRRSISFYAKELRIAVAFLLFLAAFIIRGVNPMIPKALATIAYLLAGYDVILDTTRSVRHGSWFDESFLMTLATVGAIALGDIPEAAAVMIFYQTGEILQNVAVNRSRRSITDLMNIRPDAATRLLPVPCHSDSACACGVTGERTEIVAPEELAIGDIVLIRPGERVPVDGTVISGASSLDNAALNGEAIPRDVSVGDEILGGGINLNGVLTVRVTGLFAESTVARILNLVENASAKKTRTERFITRFARIYTPVVVSLALVIAILPPLLTSAAWSAWLRRSFVFLVTSCPCALVISIPLSYFAGLGKASANGILFKGTTYLETLKNASIVTFDKTGTLTRGIFTVTETQPEPGFTRDALLEVAAIAEADSTHPIAKSILSAYGKNIDRSRVHDVREYPGRGIAATIDGRDVLVGNQRLLEENGLTIPPNAHTGTAVYVAINGQFAGTLLIGDEIKPDSRDTVIALKDLGVRKTVMLSGDNDRTVQEVAATLGIDDAYGDLLPDQKIDVIEQIIANKSAQDTIVVIGDGINDAPVLARADIGFAMGGAGSEAAIEAADVVILNDEPSKIPESIRIARRTDRIVRQNVTFILIGKVTFLILGALGYTGMWQAVFADVGIMLLAVLNAMRILR